MPFSKWIISGCTDSRPIHYIHPSDFLKIILNHPKDFFCSCIYRSLELKELEIIHLLKQGDEPAFKILVDGYKDRMYYTILNILQDPMEAEDVLQETFIQVFESIHSFKEESSLSTWMYKIAVRKALERIRKRKFRQRLLSVLPWWMPKEEKEKQGYINPGISAERKELAMKLFDAIKSLPENQRIAFSLIKVQGMKYEEVSEMMHLSVKALESLMSRANINLRKKLEQHYTKD